MHPSYERIYQAIRRIPKGRVATYGQIAALVGMPGHARQVGYALNALPGDRNVPWHRVINARGEVSPRSDADSEPIQRALLELEGIVFEENARVSLERFRWRPRSRPAFTPDGFHHADVG